MNAFLKSIVFGAMLGLTACGSASDFVDVTLLTPIGMNKKFQDYSQALLSPSSNFLIPSPTCELDQVYAGSNRFVGDTQVINKRIKLRRSADNNCVMNASSCTNFKTCMTNCVELMEPISIPVLKGQNVNVGVFGAIYDGLDSNPIDGICDIKAGVTQIPHSKSFTLAGSTVVNSNNGTSIPLSIFGVDAYSNTTPSISNSVAKNNLIILKMNCSSTPGNEKILNIEYFKSALNEDRITHYLYSNTASNAGFNNFEYIIPRILPVQLSYMNSSGNKYTTLLTSSNDTISISAFCTISMTTL